MRKGQFFSIAGLFLLVVLVIIIQTQTSFLEERQERRVDRAQIGTADSFVRTLLALDIPQVLEVSTKDALVYSSQTLPMNTYEEFEIDIRNGGSDSSVGTTAQFDLKTVVLPSETEDIAVDVIDIRQETYDTITVDFLVSVVIPTIQGVWEEEDNFYSVTVDVTGITHPTYGEVITDAWADAGGSSCLAQKLFESTLVSSCAGEIQPPTLESVAA